MILLVSALTRCVAVIFFISLVLGLIVTIFPHLLLNVVVLYLVIFGTLVLAGILMSKV